MAWFWWATTALAGEVDVVTLADALQRALDSSEGVALADEALERAKADRWRAISGALPSVIGSAGYTRTFLSEFDSPSDTSDVPTSVTPTSALAVPTLDLPFGKDNTWRVGFTANQWLYTGGRLGAGLKTVASGRRAATFGRDIARATAARDVARAWFDAALAERLLAIAEETSAHAEANRQRTRLAAEVGRLSEFERLRAEVDAQNQAVAVLRARRVRDAALSWFGTLLDAPGPVSPGAPLDDEAPAVFVADALAQVGLAAETSASRQAVLAADEGVAIAKQAVVLARANGLPNLSLTGSAGWNSYPDTLLSLKNDAWSPNVSAGFQLVVPLFNGGRTYGEVLRARADLADATTRRDQAFELAALEGTDSAAELATATAQWEATDGTVSVARATFAIAEVRVAEGAATALELTDARLLLESALANRAVAARDLAVATLHVALLSSLPISVPTGGR